MSTIFIQIASYNDDELIKTINDCINKSSKQNELHFGIHECYIDNKTNFNNPNIKITYSKAPENLGVGVGRYLANKLYDNEDYYLQIDSHTRFIENWDQLAIDNLNKYLSINNNCILTSYPPAFWYDENGIEVLDLDAKATTIKFKNSKVQRDLFYARRIVDQEGKMSDETYCTDSVSAGFIFGEGSISKVIQHPGVFYFGEEILKAASLFTNGYNLMYPDIHLVFHLYGKDSKRIPPWITFQKETDDLENFSQYVIKRIFSENMMNNIGLGSRRPLKQYGDYIGLDFTNGIILKEVSND